MQTNIIWQLQLLVLHYCSNLILLVLGHATLHSQSAKMRPIVTDVPFVSVGHNLEPKNSWTSGNVPWGMDSSVPRNHVLGWGQDTCRRRGNFWGISWIIMKYRDTLPWAVQKQMNQSTCCLGWNLGWAKGTMNYKRVKIPPTVRGTFGWWLCHREPLYILLWPLIKAAFPLDVFA